jgi:hypothetical protein
LRGRCYAPTSPERARHPQAIHRFIHIIHKWKKPVMPSILSSTT